MQGVLWGTAISDRTLWRESRSRAADSEWVGDAEIEIPHGCATEIGGIRRNNWANWSRGNRGIVWREGGRG